MLDLRDHTPRAVPRGSLVLKAAVTDQRRMTRSAARPGQEILDLSLQHVIGGQADRVTYTAAFQRLVERRQGERGIRTNHHGLPDGIDR